MRAPAAILAGACAGITLVGAGGMARPAAAEVKPRPNIILIQTDDQNAEELNRATMPATERVLVDHGTLFSHYLVATPQCCPSRAALLTGDYPHNDGVMANVPGYPDLKEPGNILPSWLQAAGYRTAHVGKYLNNYSLGPKSLATIPPGWDQWFTVGDRTLYYRYSIGIDGRLVKRGGARHDYVTRVLNREAVKLIDRWSGRSRPFYLQLDERAPHESSKRSGSALCPKGPLPDPRDRQRFADKPLREPPNFNEADIADKPDFLQSLPLLSNRRIAFMAQTQRCRLASLREVDRGVASIDRALARTNSLRRTVIVFTSDNGTFAGEHRIPDGKVVPYLPAIHEPLVVHVPPAYRSGPLVHRVDAVAANVDIAPTLLRLARARPCRKPGDCRTLDGRSLLPLIDGETPDWSAGRGILVEFSERNFTGPWEVVCGYEGVYTSTASYVDYTSAGDAASAGCQPTDQRELYDLDQDPFQLQNLYPAAPGTAEGDLQTEMESKLAELRDCAGISGRDVLPPSGHHCE